ncbi:MAG: hypothetical protein Q9208_008009 [Pyrenodesmia sp. 3 TL-2023]
MSSREGLSSKQAHALFDILSSHVNLSEIEGLKYSKNIATFGPPLQPSSFDEKSSPLLRILLQSFILDLPGLRNVAPHFWTNSIRQLATALDNSNLSESYDKGSVGIRRTLSTATASIVESVARGRLGGYPRRNTKDDAEYHLDNPDDILRAWDDFLQRIIYGDLLDKMFVKAAETKKLSDHESVVQAAHQYAIIMIISQVLSADASELRKRSKAIEQSGDALDKSQMDQLRKYASANAQEQDTVRKVSRKFDLDHIAVTAKPFEETDQISIVKAILAQNKVGQSLTDSSHRLALEYVSIQLAIRDREKLIEVLCHHQPDLLTTSIRELVKVYDPIIRALHNAVDLASGVSDAQAFLDDMISLSLIDHSKKGKIPTVQDFVHLLQKHQGSSHVFIHQALKNGKELSEWYHEYARHAVEQYKQQTNVELSAPHVAAAGDLTGFLKELVSKQSEDEQHLIIGELDRYADFLESLAAQTRTRMQKIVQASLSSSNDDSIVDGNPGMFLYKWQRFIDDTLITPGSEGGGPRTGESESVKEATAVDVDGSKPATLAYAKADGKGHIKPPAVGNVLRLLEPGFEEELRRLVDVKKGQRAMDQPKTNRQV